MNNISPIIREIPGTVDLRVPGVLQSERSELLMNGLNDNMRYQDVELELQGHRCISSFPAILPLRNTWSLLNAQIEIRQGYTIIDHPLQLVSWVIDDKNNPALLTTDLQAQEVIRKFEWAPKSQIQSIFKEIQTEYGDAKFKLDFDRTNRYRELVKDGDISDYISRKTLIDTVAISNESVENYLNDPTSPESIAFEEQLKACMPGLESIQEILHLIAGSSVNRTGRQVKNEDYDGLTPIRVDGDNFIIDGDPYVYYLGDYDSILAKNILQDNCTIFLDIRYTLKNDPNKYTNIISRTIQVKDSYINLDNLFTVQITNESIVIYPIMSGSDSPDEYYISSCKLML